MSDVWVIAGVWEEDEDEVEHIFCWILSFGKGDKWGEREGIGLVLLLSLFFFCLIFVVDVCTGDASGIIVAFAGIMDCVCMGMGGRKIGIWPKNCKFCCDIIL